VQRGFIIDRYFISRLNISQGDKKNVVIEDLHESVWLARMIDVMSTIAAPATVQTPALVYPADTQTPSASPAPRFRCRDFFAGVFGYLAPPLEMGRCKTATPLNGGFPDCQARR
jgi:hypothetical protein